MTRGGSVQATPVVERPRDRRGVLARRTRPLASLLAVLVLSITPGGSQIVSLGGWTDRQPPAIRPLHGSVSGGAVSSVESLTCDDVLELSVRHEGRYGSKLHEVTLEATLTSPEGAERRVKGFYYGGDTWKVRYRPDMAGRWTYAFSLNDQAGLSQSGEGEITCTPDSAEGPIRRNPNSPYRWVLLNGVPYFPLGLQDCVVLSDDGRLGTFTIDGEGRSDGSARTVTAREYFEIYGQAGFNLFRFSPNNCSFALFDDLETLREAESLATDELLAHARAGGLRVMFGFFGYDQSEHHRIDLLPVLNTMDIVAREKRYIEYCVARWGPYVDFWQLLNESDASNTWITMMADHVRAVDPDRKPVSTSWEKPRLTSIDINTPHWYESEHELESDLRVQRLANAWKQPGKPVIVGEHGNTGMNWDPTSALRMRVRLWTALFYEIGLVFWNTSWSKAGVNQGRYTPGATANIYLGPEERSYTRVLGEFSARLDANIRMAPVTVSEPDRVRAYGLRSDMVAAVYLHHVEDHTTPIRGLTIALELPGEPGSRETLVGEWVEPATGKMLAHVLAAPGRQTLEAPPFAVDLALLMRSPDALGDGRR